LNRFIPEITHLISEIISLGSGKSTPVNYIKAAMCQLIDLFPDLYNKKINTGDKIITMTSDLTIDSDGNILNDTQSDIVNKNMNNSTDNKKRRSVEERMKIIVNFDTELALFRQMALVSIFFT
jgi:hypothetical protein